MKSLIPRFLLVLVLFFFPVSGQTIELPDYLQLVRENHPFFEQQAYTPELLREAQNELLGDQDWAIRITPSLNYEKTASIDPFSGKSLTNGILDAGLERSFWSSGGRLSLAWQYNFLRQELGEEAIAFGIPKNNFQQAFSVRYIHPLLQNAHGKLDRLQYELKAYEIDLAEIQMLENHENFLLQAGLSFVQWVAVDEQLAIARREVKINEEQLAQTHENFRRIWSIKQIFSERKMRCAWLVKT